MTNKKRYTKEDYEGEPISGASPMIYGDGLVKFLPSVLYQNQTTTKLFEHVLFAKLDAMGLYELSQFLESRGYQLPPKPAGEFAFRLKSRDGVERPILHYSFYENYFSQRIAREEMEEVLSKNALSLEDALNAEILFGVSYFVPAGGVKPEWRQQIMQEYAKEEIK